MEAKGTPFYRLDKPKEFFTIFITLIAYGCLVQAIVAAFGLAEGTVSLGFGKQESITKNSMSTPSVSGGWGRFRKEVARENASDGSRANRASLDCMGVVMV